MTSRHDRERKAALDAARATKPKTGDAAAIYRQFLSTPAVPPRDTVSPPDTVPPRHAAPAHPDTVPARDTVSPCDTLRSVGGYTKVPNTVLDSVAAALPPHEFVVYLRLVRLTRGYGRETCTVGYARLAESCHLGKTKTVAAVKRLQLLGFVERVAEANSVERAPVYRVRIPGESVSPADTVPRRDTVPPGDAMKESSKDHETARLEILRSVAEGYRHQHPDATRSDVLARLRRFVEQEGWQVEGEAMERAIG